eukprot:CAMPEP_0182830998 /NCGR_PEP_ID=MMETSP0006_2-20121128/18876_1 /TAXON_ID=97485 /ORGANISM="Prymnesium parvum, Strain Texoma1" /LENGTH=64 /DNA_ID=CAMNT_0024958607 /DNA_START=484 /DNA_END=678 /DNA_ORIENTATION=+
MPTDPTAAPLVAFTTPVNQHFLIRRAVMDEHRRRRRGAHIVLMASLHQFIKQAEGPKQGASSHD